MLALDAWVLAKTVAAGLVGAVARAAVRVPAKVTAGEKTKSGSCTRAALISMGRAKWKKEK